MTAALALAQAILCTAIATRLARAWRERSGAGSAGACLAGVVVFFGVLLGTFLLLGLAATVTGRPLLRRDLALAATAVIALAAWRPTAGRIRKPPSSPGPSPTASHSALRDRTVRLLGIAVVGAFLTAAAILCCGFPSGYEPKAYHLPIAIQLFRTQNLQLWDREYMETLPANASLYYGDLFAFLPERLISASDLVFLGTLLLAIYLLGRSTGADPPASLVAAYGVTSVPLVSFSALETGADVAGIAFLGAAAYFALAGDIRRRSDVALAGVAGGLAFGFKSVHLVAIAFLAVAILWRRWTADDGTRRGRDALLAAGLFFSLVFALASPWLVRNQQEFHNPLYPVYVGGVSKALGWPGAPDVDYLKRRALQSEWVRSPAEWAVYPWVEWHTFGENFKHSAGLGPFFAGIVVPALLVAAWQTLRTKGRTDGRVGALLAGAVAVLASWWALGDRQPRYAMGALVFAVPLAAWMIARSRGPARRAIVGIASLAIVFMLVVVLSYHAVDFGSRFVRHREWTRHAFYGYPANVDTLPPGTTIANLVARPENFGLFGARHTNRVVNARRSFRVIGIDPPGVDGPPSISLGAETLRRLGAQYLYVSSATALDLDSDVRLVEVGRIGRTGADGRRLLLVEAPKTASAPAGGGPGGFREAANRLP